MGERSPFACQIALAHLKESFCQRKRNFDENMEMSVLHGPLHEHLPSEDSDWPR